ncbi:radical SAM/SPASM domain-containing protein [Desulfobacter sp. UBA2225]|uniref:radical SAM/SPASM domain-containing protein n=1 Tax=Desulfobacter sp. UBA2225 TaxID=1961413 RepID=UPI00257FF408|nr:radical SAM protein [Desulfobacter sp. UBA2225]
MDRRRGINKKFALGLLNRAAKIPFRACKKIILTSPFLKRVYFDNYASFRFRYLKIKKSLNLLKPRQVQWLTTYRCNFTCIHCEASAGTTKVHELTTDEAFRLIDELAEAGVRGILLSGGELLVRKDIFLIIEHILSRGLKYSLASNGFLVSEFSEEFRRLKPVLYFTSIDGLEQTNDKVRGVKGAFKKCLDAVKFFESIGVEYRTINTVVLPENIRELPELKKTIQDSGASLWRLAIPIPVGRAKENPEVSLDAEQIQYLFEFIRSASKEMKIELSEDAGYLGCYGQELRSYPFFCKAGLTYCAIMPDGEVLGCQIAYDSSFSEGNIRTRPFREIWRDGFSRFRKPCFETACRSCGFLEKCRGGCWGMRLGNKHCLKDVWDEQKTD